jgi:hypothetical protein
MRIAMRDHEAPQTSVTRTPKATITSSCHVQCADGLHQGMFRQIAAYSGTPLVFNNACWSWSDIASFFLTGGARAYVGTLWAIETQTAVTAARVFYEAALGGAPIVVALSQALGAISDSDDAGIYMVWGLPFSTLPVPTDVNASNSRAFKNLIRLLDMHIRQARELRAVDVRTNALDAARRIYADILTNFDFVASEEFAKTYREILDQLAPRKRSGIVDPAPERVDAGDSLDLPMRPLI